MTVRYEVFLGGRLLKVTDRIYVPDFPRQAADPGEVKDEHVDGQYRWYVDQREVADDVARAMLAEAESPG